MNNTIKKLKDKKILNYYNLDLRKKVKGIEIL